MRLCEIVCQWVHRIKEHVPEDGTRGSERVDCCCTRVPSGNREQISGALRCLDSAGLSGADSVSTAVFGGIERGVGLLDDICAWPLGPYRHADAYGDVIGD